MKKYSIGLDVGTKTGLCIFDNTSKKIMSISTLKIHRAMEVVKGFCEDVGSDNVLVYIENPNTWINFKGKDSISRLQGAGSIKRDYAIWCDYLDDNGIEHTSVKLQGGLKKVSPEFFERITGWKHKTSEHGRDATLMVYNS